MLENKSYWLEVDKVISNIYKVIKVHKAFRDPYYIKIYTHR